MTHVRQEKAVHLIERQQVFSRSLLWGLQERYFAEKGVDAWRRAEVPHYVTSNPTMADSYAEIVFAFWRDQQRLSSQDIDPDEPFYICELGAGSGRFAFHFLKRLSRLCELAGPAPISFCYVLTDVAERNLDFVRRHPCLQTYYEDGLLDLAHFDINQSTELHLLRGGRTISANSLERPLIAIANYLFDSIPQDLFYIDDQHYYQCLVSLFSEESSTTLSQGQFLKQLHCSYDVQEMTAKPYKEPYLQQLMAIYQRSLSDTYMLFPMVGLRGLHLIRTLSNSGLLFLSADKGQHKISALQGQRPPKLVSHHGCFSLSVNYHAFKAYCEQNAGIALFPDYRHKNLIVTALLMIDEAGSYTETQRAYQRHVQEFSPEDFHTITKYTRKTLTNMSAEEILAYIRFSFYDSHQFICCLPRLTELVPELGSGERRNLSDAVDKVWDMYYPLGEEADLAYQIGCLLYEMGDDARALTYFERSQNPPPALDGRADESGVVTTGMDEIFHELELELDWIAQVLARRFQLYFANGEAEAGSGGVADVEPPELGDSGTPWTRFLCHYELGFIERLALVLGLVPHLRPRILDVFFLKNQKIDRRFTELGGVRRGPEGDFWPTGETLAFLLEPNDLATLLAVQRLLDPRHVFARHNILKAETLGDTSPMKAPLIVSDEYLSLFTTGQPRRPDFGPSFPARYIETGLTWDDLVLHPGTRKQIAEIEAWLRHGDTLMNEWAMAAKLRPGHRSLFYGPPGTGKTVTACLLGQSTGRDVYKVDLSLVVSKYIGETEKNLAKVFDQAQNKGWVLFFDEADALFGKRTETKDAHDRFANQEVSFLLQRIETFDGIAILASNRRDNLDDAFTRRFESVIYFPVPHAEERVRLWRQGFSSEAQLEPSLDLDKIASENVLTGGSIMNVIRYASLKALDRSSETISLEDVSQGIRREYAKEGKAV